MKTKSSLPMFGTDAGVAKEMAKNLDGCRHVTILFAASLSILPYLRATHVIANDLNHRAINFYKVLKGVRGGDNGSNDLIALCENTLCHPLELSEAAAILDNEHSSNHVLKAWAYWTQCWLCRKGTGGTKSEGRGNISMRRTAAGGSNASRITTAASDLHLWADDYKKRCEFECKDFSKIIAKVKDDPTCGVYSDYVWFGAGDGYKHNAKIRDKERGIDSHEELRDGLAKFDHAKILVRYDDHPRTRELYSGSDWTITEARSRTQTNKLLGELHITKNIELKGSNSV